MSRVEKTGGSEKSEKGAPDPQATGLPQTRESEEPMAGMEKHNDDAASDAPLSDRQERADLQPEDRSTRKHRVKASRFRLYNLVYDHVVEPLVLSRNTPRFDARGVALGLVVGFGVPMGGHTLALGLLRLLMRFNFLVGIGLAAVVNPLTIVPLYYGYYCLGSFMLGRPPELDRELFEKIMHPIVDKSHFWEAMGAFSGLGADILTRWALAAALVATILGIAGYMLTEKIQQKRCRKAAENVGVGYREYLLQLERHSTQEADRPVTSQTRMESTK